MKYGRIETLIETEKATDNPEDLDQINCDYYIPLDTVNLDTLVRWLPKLCLKCGTILERKKFIDGWRPNNEPTDVNEDYYCPKCEMRWMEDAGPHKFFEEPKW
jgi:hypothetical protein